MGCVILLWHSLSLPYTHFPRFYIAGPFESLFLEKKCTLLYSNYGIKCFVIYFEAKKICKILICSQLLNKRRHYFHRYNQMGAF